MMSILNRLEQEAGFFLPPLRLGINVSSYPLLNLDIDSTHLTYLLRDNKKTIKVGNLPSLLSIICQNLRRVYVSVYASEK